VIRVTLELIPGGIGEPEHLGTIEIANNISRTLDTEGRRGTYDARIWKKRFRRSDPWGDVTVENFPRRSYHPWNLVRQVLNMAAELNGGTI
jgi:hypothetical protein